jgi:hypothetical protein
MNEVVGTALSVIAAILFYRVVERRHKVALVKVLGAVVGLGAAVFAYSIAKERQENAATRRRNQSMHIRYLPKARDGVSAFARLGGGNASQAALELCNRGSDTIRKVTFHAQAF